MAKVLTLDDLIDKDRLGSAIANMWTDWNNGRQLKVGEWKELRRYLYATDTSHTTNSKLPWSNSTTLPKLTQIRDNLYANYIATMFPKRKWLNWEGLSKRDENKKKTAALVTMHLQVNMTYTLTHSIVSGTLRSMDNSSVSLCK